MKLPKIYSLVMTAPQGLMTLKAFLAPIRKAFKPYPWIRFEQKMLCSNSFAEISDAVCVTGRFEPDWCDRSVCFVTISGYSNRENDKVRFEGLRRERILFDIFATIAHERIHMLQDRKAHGCPRMYKHHSSAVSYYGSKIEIDAYALTAVLEEHYGWTSEVLKKYRELFDPGDPIFKRFLKKKWEYSLTMPPL